jgi:hypothetical protein
MEVEAFAIGSVFVQLVTVEGSRMKRQAAVGDRYIAIDGCIFDAGRKMIFSSNGGDGTIAVIR